MKHLASCEYGQSIGQQSTDCWCQKGRGKLYTVRCLDKFCWFRLDASLDTCKWARDWHEKGSAEMFGKDKAHRCGAIEPAKVPESD